MGILSWLIVGLIAGWLAGQFVRGTGYGMLGDMIVGIVGALVGGYLASALFGIAAPLTGINLVTIGVSFLGAVLTILILRLIGGRRMVCPPGQVC
jgi:uncharacterized membrane protein YeaQ/YmgE (transglycosylase-associated protein family)